MSATSPASEDRTATVDGSNGTGRSGVDASSGSVRQPLEFLAELERELELRLRPEQLGVLTHRLTELGTLCAKAVEDPQCRDLALVQLDSLEDILESLVWTR
jgi:hypothetical protein